MIKDIRKIIMFDLLEISYYVKAKFISTIFYQ